MPTFDDHATTTAPPEEVWKALYDPARFPEWFVGVERIHKEGPGAYTMWPDGYPDFPMPQQIRTSREDGRVTISCMVSDLIFDWRLKELGAGGTRVDVRVEIPEAEAHRLDDQRASVGASLRRLMDVAAATDAPRARD
ncbi:MAG: SRPBCC family protein [Solirubrobacteraceae bacterium]|nr:SRPBCC family protein [Solirubrobacteraceae bacterium]